MAHTELGCIAFPRIIRLQMISSRDVYKMVGDAKLPRQTGLGSSFRVSQPICWSIAVTLLVRAEVVAGVSCGESIVDHGDREQPIYGG